MKKYIEDTLRCLPEIVIAFDENCKIRFINRAFERVFGKSQEDVLGKLIGESHLPFPEEIAFLEKQLSKYSQGKLEDSYKEDDLPSVKFKTFPNPALLKNFYNQVDSLSTVRLNHLNFTYRFFKVARDKDLEPWIGLLFRETTNEKNLRDQLVVAEKVAGLSSLATGIAHELNNPLQAVIAFADAIISESEPYKINEYAQTILDRASHMKLKILEIMGSLQSQAQATSEDVNVIDVLTLSVETALAEFGPTEIDVIKNFEIFPKIKAYPDEMRQIFDGLISNAIEAMDGKGQLILSSVKTSNGNRILQIQDTGSGILREHLTRVFDPFFTTKGATRTGLGLNVVYRLVEKNGGRIAASSPTNEGATFIITFPN